ncbi:hypothetical protein [Nocardia sp. NPDC005978]|uniref:hypothetical protein n=1 Tax=unclassified Nocardia TaxID=2637762 RepID=UPI0033A874A3
MHLDVDPSRRSVRLAEPADFTALSVVVTGTRDDNLLRAALVGWAEFDGAHAWLDIERLEAELGSLLTADPDWRQRFTGMLGYARASGWLDESGRAVRAHCRWTSQ